MACVRGKQAMKREGNIWVLGGDLRQEKLAALLNEDGHCVHTYALDRAAPCDGVITETTPEGLHRADCVILPLPVAAKPGILHTPLGEGKRPLADIFSRLRPGQFLCGGMVGEETAELAGEYGMTVHDYFRREELAVANAVPAALAVWAWENKRGQERFPSTPTTRDFNSAGRSP